MTNSVYGLWAGFALVLIGFIFQRVHPPKQHSIIAYYSRRALQSDEAWAFAQRFYSTLGIEIFSILLIASLLGGFFNIVRIQGMTVQGSALVAGLIVQNMATERELRRRFGTPKRQA